jgi:putative endonuclease
VNGFFVYILRCADGTLYTGWTKNLERRVISHNAGKGARYTRARLPVTLVYSESLPDESTARKREYALKKLTRQEKLSLVEEERLI